MAALTLANAPGESPLAPAQSEPWIEPDELARCVDPDGIDLATICAVTSDLLFVLSGRKFGIRTETLRPIAGQRRCGWGGSSWPDFASWASWGLVPGQEWMAANVGRLAESVILPSPVQAILEVKIDGTVLDPSEYLLYGNRKLVRGPSAGTHRWWPIYQRLDLPDTEPGTFSISLQWGKPLTEGARMAARTLACHIARYVLDNACAVPDRVTSITRQGVTETILDAQQFTQNGRTGLYLVDLWLTQVNPHGNRRRPTVTSPDAVVLDRPT